MATNNRLFWAVKAVGLAPFGSINYVSTKGVQSVGISLDFNLIQAFELGQISIYENIENIPDVSVTLEKVLDGKPLLYHLCTRGAPTGSLVGRSGQRVNVAMSLFPDTQNSASGVPVAQVSMSGMYLSSVSYQFPVADNFTESVTLVGNNRLWSVSSSGGGFTFAPNYLNTDTPVLESGGVQRRDNLVYGCGATALDTNGQVASSVCTILPPDVAGISSSGTNAFDGNGYATAVQNITVSADLGRDAIYELGHKAPYFRFVNFPVEVTCDIEIISKSGDWVSGTDTGILSGVNAGNNLANRSIRVYTQEGTLLNLGTSCKLLSVNENGGDTGGGNETVTYKFQTFNDLTISHPQDPG